MAQLLDIVKKDSTNRSVAVRIIDSTDGTPETGVVFNTAGIDLWYRREGAAVVSITEATLALLTTAHADGGFLHVSHGEYRLDLPDAAYATGANYVDIGGTVTGMIVIGGRVRLVDYDPEDTIRLGLTALPAAAADAAGGLAISDAGGLDLDGLAARIPAALVGGRMDSDVGAMQSGTISNTTLATATITAAKIATGALTAVKFSDRARNVLVSTDIATLASQTSFTLTAGSADDNAYNGMIIVVTDVVTATQKAVGVISAYTGATKTVTLREDPAVFTMAATDLVDIFPISPDILAILLDTGTTLDARIPAALVGGRMDSDVGAMQTAVITNLVLADSGANKVADSVWDEPTASHVLAGTFGKAVETIAADTTTDIPALIGALNDFDPLTDEVLANVVKINSVAAAAVRLALATGQMIPLTVDTTAFTATATEFEADDITEATADHFKGRTILWTTGVLAGQSTDITVYALATGRGHFTVTALTEAPGNNDTGIII